MHHKRMIEMVSMGYLRHPSGLLAFSFVSQSISGLKYSTMGLESIRFILPRVSTRIESGHGLDEPSLMMSLLNVQPI